MANIRVKDLPNTNAANDNDEFIVDSSTSGTRRLSYSELKSEISTDFAADVATYGIATLDSDNKLTASQIPDSLAQGMNFVGVANSAGDLTSTTQGDFYVIQTAFGVYSVGDQAVYDGSAYVRVVDGTKEITEGGTGATTLDDAKGNLEVPDVGTAPNEVPMNGMLGSMAFQSAEGISAANAEIETLEVTDKVSGTLNIATGSPEAIADADADDLVIGDGVLTNFGATIATNSSGQAKINFADGAGANAARGQIKYDHQFDKLSVSTAGGERVVVDEYGRVGIGTASPSQLLHIKSSDPVIRLEDSAPDGIYAQIDGAGGGLILTADSTSGAASSAIKFRIDGSTSANDKWAIYNSGNLVSLTPGNIEISNGNLIIGTSGKGIDFGSAASGTGTPITNGGLLDDYEAGTFTPQVADATSGGNVGSAATATGSYTKVGRVVHFSITLGDIDTTGMTSGNTFYIRNLPFVSSTDPAAQLAAKTDNVTFDAGIVGSVVTGQSNAYLVSLRSANTDVNRTVGHIASGVADILLSGSYIAA
jgi:hypothetical protein